jgi:hypothetical protein
VTADVDTRHRSPIIRLLQVIGLAVVALAVATAADSLKSGLILAGAILVGELLWTMGAATLRSRKRRHNQA